MVDMSTLLDRLQVQQQQHHIIQTSTKLFGSYGVKAMTMDDIAVNCGISKKTLYRLFENKYELLEVVIANIHIRLSEAFSAIRECGNAIEEVMLSLPLILKIFRSINYRMLLELEKYHYDIWRKVEAFRQEVIRDFILANLRRGQAEGLYRDDVDFEIIATMRLQQLIQLHSMSDMVNSNVPYALEQLTHHYLSGVATTRGRNQLKKLGQTTT